MLFRRRRKRRRSRLGSRLIFNGEKLENRNLMTCVGFGDGLADVPNETEEPANLQHEIGHVLGLRFDHGERSADAADDFIMPDDPLCPDCPGEVALPDDASADAASNPGSTIQITIQVEHEI